MSPENKQPRVSIVIPCYNHGQYIQNTIDSIEEISDKTLYELIIINDGSTDEFTNKKMEELRDKGYHVIFQHNQGLSASRNNAISIAKADYILPVDADNMIRPEYVYRGIEILDGNKNVSVVYGNSQFFGDKNGIFKPGEFNLQKLMLENFIDACAFYRKEVWEKTNGYDTALKALEDWEMWLHAAFLGFEFQYIDEILFDYRILNNSMIRAFNVYKTNNNFNIEYMMGKHKKFFGPQYIDDNIMKKFFESPSGFIGKIFLKKYFPKKFDDLVLKGKLRKYI